MTAPRVPEIERTFHDFVRRGQNAQKAVDVEIKKATERDADGLTWAIWAPEHRAWWKPQELGYTENALEAGTYSTKRAIEIWINSGYNDTPVPYAAAVLLMAELENKANGLVDR